MNTKINNPTILHVSAGIRRGVSLALTLTLSAVVLQAQNDDDDVIELEALEVKAFAQGLEKSMRQARESLNLKGVMNSDTMGKLPDDNAAEALSRLSGISLSDNEGEGRYIAIRGVAANLNNVTMNGQAIAASDTEGQDGRAAPLDVLSAASISEIEVYKSVTPEMDLQSVGGAINIKTRSPFDYGGRPYETFTGSYGTNTQNDGAPRYGFSFVKGFTFGNENQWGFNVAGNYSINEIMNFRYRNTNARLLGPSYGDGYKSPDGTENPFGDILVFENARQEFKTHERERYGANVALEFKPNDDTHAWLRYYMTESTDVELAWETNYRARSIENDERARITSLTTGFSGRGRITGILKDELQERPVHQIVLGGEKKFGNVNVESNVVFTNAKETRPYEWRNEFEETADNYRIRAGGLRNNPTFESSAVHYIEGPDGYIQHYMTDNADYILGVVAEEDNRDLRRVWPSFQAGRTDVGFEDKGFYVMAQQQFNPVDVEEDTMTANIDFNWDSRIGDKDTKWSAGFKYRTTDKHVDKLSQRWNPRGKAVFADGFGDTITGDLTQPLSNVFGKEVFPYGDYGHRPQWMGSRAALQAELEAGLAADEPTMRYNEGSSISNSAEDDYALTEDIMAGYFMFNTEISKNFQLFGGARYEETDATITTILVTETPVLMYDEDAGMDIYVQVPNILPPVDTSVLYENLAPNLQFRWEAKDNLVVRGAATQTIGRPDYVDLGSPGNAQLEFDFDDNDTEFDYSDDYDFEAEAALPNPELEPYEATNYDLSIAHYFDDNKGYFSAGAFYKHIEGEINEVSVLETNVPFSSLVERFGVRPDNPWVTEGFIVDELEIETVVNGTPEQKWGYEFELQRTLDDLLPDALQGFGFSSNITFLDSERTISRRPDEELGAPEKLYNVQLFYERHGWDARLAFRHQGETTSYSDERNGLHYDQYTEARGYLDLTLRYQISDNWRVSLSGRNLNDEKKKRYYIDPHMAYRLGDIEQYGTNYELAFSWSR